MGQSEPAKQRLAQQYCKNLGTYKMSLLPAKQILKFMCLQAILSKLKHRCTDMVR